MEKLRVLYVSQEITPFLPETTLSTISRKLPQGVQEIDKEVRVFMPRYGCINERRHQLHEVIRLSGMNIIINDNDHPLIIKVASIPSARMQVYFIDNEDYFKRKNVVSDDSGKFFDDNDERSIFFCRGVLETVKKLGWVPDVIHCHGWMTALMPAYVKRFYGDDPHFADTKVVYSVYDNGFEGSLDKKLAGKMKSDGFTDGDVTHLKAPDFVNLTKMAVQHADGVILGSEKVDAKINSFLKESGKPVLQYQEEDRYIPIYNEFYDKVAEALLVD
ncbi:MAG TPA: glycogen synthase [Flavobacteriales bacterium]|nr:glycogen synthase [Flavobacteriales bacterium]HCA82362.1 glycogen synthase [Flavobacteriales bacterium]HRE73587.1 glycogen/starch synthase [Flavobacteriales bacterium]HRE97140.1 glycogen/starch synthase [Flavobacteriales bacterium]HRJ35408.1 glycogen/starch synthase [Flavobacteriales bacterium]